MSGQTTLTRALPITMLRHASQLILSTPKGHLARRVPDVVNWISACPPLLTTTFDHKGAKGSDGVAIVHRFLTQVSALLQDRTVERQWAAVVLVKAIIERGGHDLIQQNRIWVKSLLSILQKQNLSTVHRLTILTLTRIFLLIHGHPALVRELATPSLPPFITACLGILQRYSVRKDGNTELVWTILEALICLLTLHPTIFRPFQSQLQETLRLLIAPSATDFASESRSTTNEIRDSAQRLFVQLHRCAPKATAAEEWQARLSSTVEIAHDTTDLVFRGLTEFWQADGRSKPVVNAVEIEMQSNTSPLQLPAWKGISAGCKRLGHLLGLLKCFFTSPNTAPVNCKVGQVLHLLTRLFMLRVPSPAEERQSRDYIFSPQVSKEELMEALHNLPSIHTSALDLLAAVVDRLGPSLMSTTSINYISQLARLFDTERQDLYLRAQSYRLVRMIIEQTGPALHQNFTRSLSTIMMECSTDCLSPIQSLDHNTSQDSKTNPTQTEPNSKKIPKELQEEASALLTTLLSKLPRNSVSIGTRARLDQAAVLSCNQEALAASVLNPGARSSMLPFLTRAFSSTAECEAILRPRFPPLTDGLGGLDGTSEEGIEDEGQIEETEADVNEEDDAEQDPGTLSTTNAHNLVERKRKVDGVEDVPSQPPAPNATGSHQEPVARPEQPQVSDRASASENVDDTAYEAHDVQAQTSSWPSKRVRFSDPEAQTLGHATSSAHNSHLEQQALVSRQITVFTAEPTVDEAATPIDDRSTGETEGEEDEDEFEVPALTMEQDTTDEEE